MNNVARKFMTKFYTRMLNCSYHTTYHYLTVQLYTTLKTCLKIIIHFIFSTATAADLDQAKMAVFHSMTTYDQDNFWYYGIMLLFYFTSDDR